MNKNTYKSMNEKITPDGELLRRTLALAGGKTRPASPPRGKRLIALAAAVLCAALLTVPAFAAGPSAVYELVYSLSPAAAQYFKPVNMACEDNGIRMEVLSAYVDGDTAAVYISMQDLTGDRIDGTTDLFDSASIYTAFDNASTCRQVSYDEETRTATFLITMTQFDGQDVAGSKITFSVSQFLSHKQTYDGPITEFNAPLEEKATQIVCDSRTNYEAVSVLVPDSISWTPLSGDGITVTAMGYVDGKLHVQIHCENILETDNHGYVYFLDGDGQELPGESVSFWDEEGTGAYYEFVFDISPEELTGQTMYGCFTTCGTLTEGYWEVTFPLERGET